MGDLINTIIRDLLISLGRFLFARLPLPVQKGCTIIALVFIVPFFGVVLYVLVLKLTG